MLFHVNILSRSQAVPKQLFRLGNKQSAITQTTLLSSLSKRTLSNNSDSSEHPSKKRKITNDENLKLTQSSDQV